MSGRRERESILMSDDLGGKHASGGVVINIAQKGTVLESHT